MSQVVTDLIIVILPVH